MQHKNDWGLQWGNTTLEAVFIGIDVTGPFVLINDGNLYIVLVMDYHNKLVETYVLSNQVAETVAEKLVEELISKFEVPLQLHYDRERNL